MFTDEHRRSVWDQIRQQDLRAFDKLLTPAVLADAAVRAGVAMGRGPLCLANLAWLGIACAVHAARNFADVLGMTLKLMRDAQGWRGTEAARRCRRRRRCGRRGRKAGRRGPHDPRPAWGDGSSLSEEAFSQARNKAPPSYWVALILLLGERFRDDPDRAGLLNWGAYRLLAIDGTTLDLPAWRKLREHFGSASNGKGGRRTQARMVMLAFPTCRLPWKYELCPLGRSEKSCADSLLAGLCPRDLVLMDKGFWSYKIFCQVARQGAFFAIRLFKGVVPKTVRRLSRDGGDALATWSPTHRPQGLPPSMPLRVIRYRVPGFRPTALVTNLLDRRITRRRWVGLATREPAGLTLDRDGRGGGVYHRRWEIETTFCELKVRQKMEGSLRGRTPRTIAYEVAGHVLLYLLVRWLIVEAAGGADPRLDPLRVSYLHALNELADIAPALLTASPARASRVLVPRLLARVAAHVVPRRPGRHYPRPGDTKVKYKGRGKYRLPSKLGRCKA